MAAVTDKKTETDVEEQATTDASVAEEVMDGLTAVEKMGDVNSNAKVANLPCQNRLMREIWEKGGKGKKGGRQELG